MKALCKLSQQIFGDIAKTGDFESHFGSLQVIRSSKFFRQVYINPLWAENVQKIEVLPLKKSSFRSSNTQYAQEAFFKGLKINFLSDKTPIFLHSLIIKG